MKSALSLHVEPRRSGVDEDPADADVPALPTDRAGLVKLCDEVDAYATVDRFQRALHLVCGSKPKFREHAARVSQKHAMLVAAARELGIAESEEEITDAYALAARMQACRNVYRDWINSFDPHLDILVDTSITVYAEAHAVVVGLRRVLGGESLPQPQILAFPGNQRPSPKRTRTPRHS